MILSREIYPEEEYMLCDWIYVDNIRILYCAFVNIWILKQNYKLFKIFLSVFMAFSYG